MNVPKKFLNFKKIGKLIIIFVFGFFLWNVFWDFLFTDNTINYISHFSSATFVGISTALLFHFWKPRPEENIHPQKN